MNKVKCSVCTKEFPEMEVKTLEVSYRLFSGEEYMYNKSGNLKFCKSCTKDFMGVVDISMGSSDKKVEV